MTGPSGGTSLPTPPLCERCWFPVNPGEAARRRLVQSLDGTVGAGWEHTSAPCTRRPAVTEEAA